MTDLDEERPALVDVQPGPSVPCDRPCGWCTPDSPCESVRAGMGDPYCICGGGADHDDDCPRWTESTT